ncbi:hypothetical protein KM043_010931 [Ampulex compressa]|nr:hypothetical protein KM043_010931 [Ampulex compressa]
MQETRRRLYVAGKLETRPYILDFFITGSCAKERAAVLVRATTPGVRCVRVVRETQEFPPSVGRKPAVRRSKLAGIFLGAHLVSNRFSRGWLSSAVMRVAQLRAGNDFGNESKGTFGARRRRSGSGAIIARNGTADSFNNFPERKSREESQARCGPGTRRFES